MHAYVHARFFLQNYSSLIIRFMDGGFLSSERNSAVCCVCVAYKCKGENNFIYKDASIHL